MLDMRMARGTGRPMGRNNACAGIGGIRMDKTFTEKISGYVEHIIYRNTENGYTVFELIADGEEITCVGSFQAIDEGEGLELSGGYVEHAVYGIQFKIGRASCRERV